jgi:hypothetical protein
MTGLVYPDKIIDMPDNWSLLDSEDQELSTTNISVTIEGTDNQLKAVMLRITADYSFWKHISLNEIFMYSSDREGPVLGGGFDVTKPMFFTVFMKSEALTMLSLTTYSLESIAELLQSEKFNYKYAENYVLDTVTQEKGPLEIGLKMRPIGL